MCMRSSEKYVFVFLDQKKKQTNKLFLSGFTSDFKFVFKMTGHILDIVQSGTAEKHSSW